jgi:hypothetical protein
VIRALNDNDDQVRTRAFYEAVSSGVELPTDYLRGMALHDRSPEIRFLALQALSDNAEAGAIAEMALNDSSEHVRNKANEILLQLEGESP